MEEDVWNEKQVGVASSIWLLMGKGYRISRSIRLQWFFQYLNKIVSPKSAEEIVSLGCFVVLYSFLYLFYILLYIIFFFNYVLRWRPPQ